MAADRKDTNPKDAAASDRLDLSLFPTTAVAYGALAMTEGDYKYRGFNYRVSGVSASVYVAACKRHLDKWYASEDEDPMTRVPHLGNAIACLAVIIDALECGKLNDDRPPVGEHQPTEFFERMRTKVKHLQELFPRREPRFTRDDE